jgi:hypothetical protein
MTSEEYVKVEHPQASCFFTTTYWPGCGTHKRWLVTLTPVHSVSRGDGETPEEAWETAAQWVRWRKELKEVKESFSKLSGVFATAEP